MAYGESSPDAEPYTWFVHDLRRAQIGQPWQMTWTGEDSDSALRMFFAGQEGSEVTLAQSPSLRRANQDARKAHDFMAPHLLVERPEEGDGNLFATVYDCWPEDSAPAVRSVTWERLGVGAAAPLALRVQLDDREDIIYCSLDDEAREIASATFSGSWAVVSRQAGKVSWAWTNAGSVRAGGLDLSAQDTIEFALVAVRRIADGDDANAFVVEGTLADAPLLGTWVRALLGDREAYGYELTAVREEDGRTMLEISGEPGFAVADGRWELLFNPFYEGEGPCRVEIARSAFASR